MNYGIRAAMTIQMHAMAEGALHDRMRNATHASTAQPKMSACSKKFAQFADFSNRKEDEEHEQI